MENQKHSALYHLMRWCVSAKKYVKKFCPKTKSADMDLYKSLSKAIQKVVPKNWTKVTVKIKSSLNVMCSFQT